QGSYKSRPLDSGMRRNDECASALGVLRPLAGLVQPDLLALHLARIAGDEAGLAQRAAQRLVVGDERAGDAEARGAGLARHAAAADHHADIEIAAHLDGLQ